jgi:uncharacterized membrane protein
MSKRLGSIDLLRGLVMVIMALDHVRDYFTNTQINPLDVAQTWPALFFTRWITHFCAPVFVFLAGTGAYLYRERVRSAPQVARFLWTRGLWLVFLELTVMRLGWSFSWSPSGVAVVIWAIGWSMVLLAPLVYFPTKVAACIGIAILLLHDAVARVPASSFGAFSWLWTVLFRVDVLPIGSGHILLTAYPVAPWFGVLACGYAAGALFKREPDRRRTALRAIGAGAIALFLILRWFNVYGNPRPWAIQPELVRSVYSFLNCDKYPPSLLFLLMTLGPALLLLSYLPDAPKSVLRPFVVFGRVPLFYYLLHIPLLHGIATFLAVRKFGSAPWMFAGLPNSLPGTTPNPAWGYDLAGVYLFWIAIVLMLYPLCAWFARVKESRRDTWLSYL